MDSKPSITFISGNAQKVLEIEEILLIMKV